VDTVTRMIASYLRRDETPEPVVMAVSVGVRDIATAEIPHAHPGHEDPDAVLARLGYRRLGLWRTTNVAAAVDVEPST
jgi:hypothetical protein